MVVGTQKKGRVDGDAARLPERLAQRVQIETICRAVYGDLFQVSVKELLRELSGEHAVPPIVHGEHGAYYRHYDIYTGEERQLEVNIRSRGDGWRMNTCDANYLREQRTARGRMFVPLKDVYEELGKDRASITPRLVEDREITYFRYWELPNGNERHVRVMVDRNDHNRRFLRVEDAADFRKNELRMRRNYMTFAQIEERIHEGVPGFDRTKRALGRDFITENIERVAAIVPGDGTVDRVNLRYRSIARLGKAVAMRLVKYEAGYILRREDAEIIIADEIAKRTGYETVSNLARHCGVSGNTVRAWCRKNRIAEIKTGRDSYVPREFADRMRAEHPKVHLPKGAKDLNIVLRKLGLGKRLHARKVRTGEDGGNYFEHDVIDGDTVGVVRVPIIRTGMKFVLAPEARDALVEYERVRSTWSTLDGLYQLTGTPPNTLRSYIDSKRGVIGLRIDEHTTMDVRYVVHRHQILIHPEDAAKAVQCLEARGKMTVCLSSIVGEEDLVMLAPHIDLREMMIRVTERAIMRRDRRGNVACTEYVDDYNLGIPFEVRLGKGDIRQVWIEKRDEKIIQFCIRLAREDESAGKEVGKVIERFKTSGLLSAHDTMVLAIARSRYVSDDNLARGMLNRFFTGKNDRLLQPVLIEAKRMKKHCVKPRELVALAASTPRDAPSGLA